MSYNHYKENGKIENNMSSEKTRYVFIPTEDQFKFVTSHPIHCFCKKPAYIGYTLEYGPILECFSYGSTYQNTCGFHLHGLSWKELISDLKQGRPISSDYIELITCPLYNFTFRVIFNVKNSYKIIPPSKAPDCFCNLPVHLRESPKNGLYFSCVNSEIEGKRRCSWYLEAKEVAFNKPKYRLHTYVDSETYQEKINQKTSLTSNKSKYYDEPSSSVSDLNAEMLSYFKKASNDLLGSLDESLETVRKDCYLTLIERERQEIKRKNNQM